MAVVNLNLSLEQVLEFIKNLPTEYKKATFEQLKTESKTNLINELEGVLYVEKTNFQEEILSKKLLVKVSEINIDLLDIANSKEKIENDFNELILTYQQIGNKYEQLIHQTKVTKEALQIKYYLENMISIANFYLGKIKKQFDKEQQFLESLTNEIENIEELNQDIQLKFFDIPKTSINEILKRI